MIAVLSPDCSLRDKAEVVRLVEGYGLRVQVSETDDASLVAVIGQGGEAIVEVLDAMRRFSPCRKYPALTNCFSLSMDYWREPLVIRCKCF